MKTRYGRKLHLATTVAGVWIPLAARLTPANEADSRLAPTLLEELPGEAGCVLGDTHYDAPEVRMLFEGAERLLGIPRHGPYPHADAGVDVRRIFHLPPSMVSSPSTPLLAPQNCRRERRLFGG